MKNLLQSELAKYLTVGTFNSLFGLIIFIIIDLMIQSLSDNRITAYMSATVITTPLIVTQSFFTQNYITFKNRNSDEKLVFVYLRFLFVSIWVLGLKVITMPILVEIFGFHPWLSAIIVNFLKAIISYIGHSKFTFKNIDNVL